MMPTNPRKRGRPPKDPANRYETPARQIRVSVQTHAFIQFLVYIKGQGDSHDKLITEALRTAYPELHSEFERLQSLALANKENP